MKGPRLRRARPQDVPAIENLLKAEWLPPFSILEFLETFWVLAQEGGVVGSAGLEVYGQAALLRSVVVAPSLRGRRLGERLTQTALEEARWRGVRRVYLFTMRAAPFFARFGFRECSLDDLEPAVRESWQYRGVSTMPELRQSLRPMQLNLHSRGLRAGP